MQTTLLTTGIALMAAAIVGGGLKGFGLEIPGLGTLRRQILLGLLGVGVACGGWVWQGDAAVSAPSSGAGRVEAAPAVSLVGSWRGGPDCLLNIHLDDGKNLVGDCDTPVIRHHLTGHHVAPDQVTLTLERTDDKGCRTSVEGSISVLDSSHIQITQAGWSGCGVQQATPASQLLSRT